MIHAHRWKGWWQQEGYGRQHMQDLTFHFDGGEIRGAGHDIVGSFTFAGTYDDAGAVSMVKQYVGKHHVIYHGRFDGEGAIHGEWNIMAAWFGPFAIMAEGGAYVDEDTITAIVPEPGCRVVD